MSLTLIAGLPRLESAEPAPPLPPGIVEFAGRISHNHWHLFGPEQRGDLETLNLELRDAQQQLR